MAGDDLEAALEAAYSAALAADAGAERRAGAARDAGLGELRRRNADTLANRSTIIRLVEHPEGIVAALRGALRERRAELGVGGH